MFGKFKDLNKYKKFGNKLITKNHGIQNKETFKSKYEKSKLLKVWKYK